MFEVFIAVGSNINPEENIIQALLKLKSYRFIQAISDFYKTASIAPTKQPDFLNGVIKIHTFLSPRVLKYDVLRKIEDELGRVRTADKFAARTIDLDVIIYDKLVLDLPGLKIPDPNIRIYPFVAAALLQLKPDLILPDTQTPLANEPILKQKENLCLESEFTEKLRKLII